VGAVMLSCLYDAACMMRGCGECMIMIRDQRFGFDFGVDGCLEGWRASPVWGCGFDARVEWCGCTLSAVRWCMVVCGRRDDNGLWLWGRTP
jgi:hypothetical protein